MINNLQICKDFYNIFNSSAADHLRKMIINSPFYLIESELEDIRLNSWAIVDISESGSWKIMKATLMQDLSQTMILS